MVSSIHQRGQKPRGIERLHVKLTLQTGTAGLGAQTIETLAAHEPASIYFTGRNEKSANDKLELWRPRFPNTNFVFVACDLASFQSIDRAATSLLAQCHTLDILIANAGVMAVEPSLTEDGYEIQFGTNHMGHALLVQLLLPALNAATEPRVVSLTSQGYAAAPKSGIDYKDIKPESGKVASSWGPVGFFQKWVRYGNGKLANILYAEQLRKHEPKITAIAVHPGVVFGSDLVGKTGISHQLFIRLATIGKGISVEDGVKNPCWAATCDEADLEGAVYAEPVGNIMPLSGWDEAARAKQGEELWAWTQEQLRQGLEAIKTSNESAQV